MARDLPTSDSTDAVDPTHLLVVFEGGDTPVSEDPAMQAVRDVMDAVSGLHFRDPPDEFTGADLAACRTARDTYFNAIANADAKTQFTDDRALAIILNPTSSTDNTFETWIGSASDTSADALWVERTDAVRGPQGRQGRFDVFCYENAATVPAAPTGGSYVLGTGVLTVPTGTTAAPVEPPTNEFTWVSRATINPQTQTGTVTPTWSVFTTDVEASLAARAETAETNAETAQTAAEAAQTAAETARTGAETAETNAETAETGAETAETAAEAAQAAAEAAVTGAEEALANSGTALAFNELWSGDIDITTASQWKAVGTEAVPSNATWLIWNGGTVSGEANDGPAALSTWINAAAWRALTADTADTTPGDGTGMLIVDWVATNIGDGSPDFARRDAIIGRTSGNIPLITSANTGEDFYGATLRYITQAVATPGGGGGGLTQAQVDARIDALALRQAQNLADLASAGTARTNLGLGSAAQSNTGTTLGAIPVLSAGGRLADGRIPTGVARDTEVAAAYAALAGATFTGAVSGITPTTDAHLATKAYVDSVSSGGSGGVTDDIYWGTSADETPEDSELSLPAVNGAAEISGYSGDMHVLVARLATEADLTRIVRSDDISQTNQLGAFTKSATTVMPGSETEAFNVWVSNQALTQAAAVTWTAS